jgi:FeS assembly protein IscX
MRWTDIEDIAECLEESHPEIDIITLRFTTLKQMIIDLHGFTGEHSHSNERVLEAIQGAWIELREKN